VGGGVGFFDLGKVPKGGRQQFTKCSPLTRPELIEVVLTTGFQVLTRAPVFADPPNAALPNAGGDR
jgi:hypothetical protein